jgi:hypothetical protein
MAGQEGAPDGGEVAALSLPGGHVSADRAGRMLHAQFRPELQGDPVLTPLRMIGRDAADEVDVVPRDCGSGVSGPEQWPGTLSLKYGDLVTKEGVLSCKGGPGSTHTSEGASDQKEP